MTIAAGAPTTGPAADSPTDAVSQATPPVDPSEPAIEVTDPAVPEDQAAADDARDDTAIGREAARYRVRMREAKDALAQAEMAHSARVTELEAAHAATAATLDAQRMAVVDMAIRSAKLEPESFRPHLLVALGESGVGTLVDADTGTVDVARLVEAVRSTAAAFTPAPTGPQPNRQQGVPSPGRGGGATWAGVIGDAARRRR